MKRLSLSLLISALVGISLQAQTWVDIQSPQPKPAQIVLTSGNTQSTQLQFTLSGYSTKDVMTPTGLSKVISVEEATEILEAGSPDLPKLSASLIIPDDANMSYTVTASSYIEYQNVNIAPSKGNLTRDIDPATVPYTYGSAYSQDGFFPGKLAELREPYIMREVRGQTLIVYPFQYNPATHTLRVYTNLEVNVYRNGTGTTNVLTRNTPNLRFDPEFAEIYKTHFINYNQTHKYTTLGETGKLLIICYGNYMAAMEPYVIWKKTEGIQTEMVNVTTAGATAAAIKTYVTNYYNTNGLTFLLLVGDAAQIPTFTVSGGGSDNSYGYIVGTDHYQEILVGRFSAESTADVTTQVQRTVNYEKTPSMSGNKFNRCIGIGSDQGPGDDNEMDFEHQRNIQTDLMGFTYTSQVELFDGSQGGLDAAGNPTATMLLNEVNAGAGIITYTGHGADNSFVTTGFSNTTIASLTNVEILPFIWSVACVNGNFTAGTCFAEAWLRKQHNNQPAGAVATLMSTINQSWNPPMEGQDEMVDILVESYTNNIKRTFGGLSVNGLFKMNDTYADYAMTDTWNLFGDPSLMVRTDNPATMVVTHDPTINIGETSMVVNCNVDGALVCLTIDHEIIGTAYANGGSATITFPALSLIDTITVCATAFNYVPYLGEVMIVSNNYPNDAQMMSIVKPIASYACSGNTELPEVVLRNMGTNTLTSCTITYTIDAGTPVVYNWTGNLAQFASENVILSGFPLTLGNHIFSVTVTGPNGVSDDNPSNDNINRDFAVSDLTILATFTADPATFCSAPATVQFTNQSANAQTYLWDFGDGTTSTDENPTHVYNNLGAYTVVLTADAGVCGNDVESQTNYIVVGATPPVVTDASNCGPASLTLTATANGTLNWYDAPTGGSLIGSGNTYVTPNLSTTTSYYVENQVVQPNQYVGSVSSNGNGGYFTSAYVHYLIFSCYQACTLVSVEVNAGASGNRTIELQNSAGTVLQSTTVSIPTGVSRITLNFNIPVGTDLRLVGPISPNLYRNNAGVSYPYEINGLISITSSSAGTTPLDFYYYFYNWEVLPPQCISARETVTAFINNNPPDAQYTYVVNGFNATFTDQSSNPAFYLWDFGDGNTSTSANPTHTYGSDGTYTVKLVISNGCGQDSISQNVIVNTVGISESSDKTSISVYPNPAQPGLITMVIGNCSGNSMLEIRDAWGRLITKFDNPQASASGTIIRWDASKVAAGMYLIHFIDQNGEIVRKLVISN